MGEESLVDQSRSTYELVGLQRGVPKIGAVCHCGCVLLSGDGVVKSKLKRSWSHWGLMSLGCAALGIWPVYVTLSLAQDLPGTGMAEFVLLYVPLLLLMIFILWAPAAILAASSDNHRGVEVFATGACFSQVLSFGLALTFDIIDRRDPMPILAVAIIFLGAPLLVHNELVNSRD